jgi:hypothetical protein
MAQPDSAMTTAEGQTAVMLVLAVRSTLRLTTPEES